MLGSTAILLLLASATAPGQTGGDCLVEYRPGNAVGEVALTAMSEDEADSMLATLDDWMPSQQRTAFFNLQGAGTLPAGVPLDSTAYVLSNRARQIRLRIDFRDHAGGGVNAMWINEKLLYLQVWHSRIASTDMILDIDSGEFIYEESANHGRLLNPCQ
jgi:hypothetical protein